VIIMSYVQLDEAEVLVHRTNVVHVDERNSIVALGSDVAQPVPGAVDQLSSR
jgi:aspartate 1-decarboxylase